MTSCKSWYTFAPVFINTIYTLGTIPAGIAEALIYVVLAVGSSCAIWAVALVPVDKVLARASMKTGHGRTLINFLLAEQPRVTRMANTSKCIITI